MADKKVPTCGDCIHADVCEQNPLHTEFSRDNPAYCEGFKDKSKLVEVVRCKDCKYYRPPFCLLNDNKHGWLNHVLPEHFCSYGGRRADG